MRQGGLLGHLLCTGLQCQEEYTLLVPVIQHSSVELAVSEAASRGTLFGAWDLSQKIASQKKSSSPSKKHGGA